MSDLTPATPDDAGTEALPADLLGGGFDMGALLEQAMEMQQQLLDAQSTAADTVVEGQAGGGAVKIRVTGAWQFESVTISPAAVDPDDVELLADLVLAALHDAVDQIGQLQQASMGGFDLGAMGGALGLGAGGDDEQDEQDEPDEDDGATDAASSYAGPVQDLIDELGRLPGVGPKSAQRIAFHLLKLPTADATRLARAIVEAKERVTFCTRCFNIAEGGECAICTDTRRDTATICVVEESRDIVAVEKTGEYRGRYHVLQGAISPIEGVGPDQLRVRELLARLDGEGITEIILCTNPNLEGEATAMYLSRLIKPLGVKVTRIASGLPVGGDLEYADELTLGRALEGRREVDPA